MIPDQYNMLSSFQYRYQSLRFSSLCGLINKYLSKLELFESSIECGDTCSTYDFSILKDLIFSLPLQVLQLFVLFITQISLFLFLLE